MTVRIAKNTRQNTNMAPLCLPCFPVPGADLNVFMMIQSTLKTAKYRDQSLVSTRFTDAFTRIAASRAQRSVSQANRIDENSAYTRIRGQLAIATAGSVVDYPIESVRLWRWHGAVFYGLH